MLLAYELHSKHLLEDKVRQKEEEEQQKQQQNTQLAFQTGTLP